MKKLTPESNETCLQERRKNRNNDVKTSNNKTQSTDKANPYSTLKRTYTRNQQPLHLHKSIETNWLSSLGRTFASQYATLHDFFHFALNTPERRAFDYPKVQVNFKNVAVITIGSVVVFVFQQELFDFALSLRLYVPYHLDICSYILMSMLLVMLFMLSRRKKQRHKCKLE